MRQYDHSDAGRWGANDLSFLALGAEAFKCHLPDAEVHLLETGQSGLDEQTDAKAGLVLDSRRHTPVEPFRRSVIHTRPPPTEDVSGPPLAFARRTATAGELPWPARVSRSAQTTPKRDLR